MQTQKKIILTGDRPTGQLHLGHYIGSLKNRVALQHEYNQFIMVADVQALTDNAKNPEKIRNNILETAIDNIAVGVDPAISTYFIQSLVPEIAELTVFYLNLVTVARLQRNPTVKDEIKQKGMGGEVPAGFLCYPVSQAADITIFNAHVVPVGQDQVPVIEQTIELVRRFNSIYGDVFVEPQALVPQGCARLPGIDGQAKMGKTLGNAIYFNDASDEIHKKVMNMYTDPGHIHVNDPGKVEGNVVFTYLDIFDPHTAEVEELKAHYRRGGLGDVVIKKRLSEILQNLIAPIRQRRQELAKDRTMVFEILRKGTEKARAIARQTMAKVRSAMKIDYFN